MVQWKSSQMRNGPLVDRERLESMLLALNDKSGMRWFWQRQLAELKLDRSFPNRYDTQVNDVRVSIMTRVV
jgi:hypothetical protein